MYFYGNGSLKSNNIKASRAKPSAYEVKITFPGETANYDIVVSELLLVRTRGAGKLIIRVVIDRETAAAPKSFDAF